MTSIILEVPYKDKDQAKTLGAKWNPELKKWYITDKQDSTLFANWIKKPLTELKIIDNVKASAYYVAENKIYCYRCKHQAKVFGILICSPYQYCDTDDLNDFETYNTDAFIYYIHQISTETLQEIKKFATNSYYMDFSQIINRRYLMNHCEHCDAPFGDFWLYGEPSGAFAPIDQAEADEIKIRKINGKFEVNAGAWSICEIDSTWMTHVNV